MGSDRDRAQPQHLAAAQHAIDPHRGARGKIAGRGVGGGGRTGREHRGVGRGRGDARAGQTGQCGQPAGVIVMFVAGQDPPHVAQAEAGAGDARRDQRAGIARAAVDQHMAPGRGDQHRTDPAGADVPDIGEDPLRHGRLAPAIAACAGLRHGEHRGNGSGGRSRRVRGGRGQGQGQGGQGQGGQGQGGQGQGGQGQGRERHGLLNRRLCRTRKHLHLGTRAPAPAPWYGGCA